MFRVAILSLCILAVTASPYKDCGSALGTITDLQVTDCANDAKVCILKKGTSAGISIKFKTASAVNGVKVSIHGVVAGVPVPFPAPQPDGCKDSGLSCPLAANQEYAYTMSLPVQKVYPSLKVVVKFELIDTATSKDIVCASIPAQIQG